MFRKFINILFCLLGLFSVQAQESFNTLIYKGNRKFDNKKYDQATSVFTDAVKKKANDFGAHYNLGNSLYKKKMYDQAKAEYQKAQNLTKDSNEKAASFYNLGNAYFQTGDMEKATDAYKNALKYDPNNNAILKNLQIAKKQKQQNQKQSGQQNNNSQQDNSNQNNQNPNKEGDSNQENKNQNTKTQDNGNQGVENKGTGNQGKIPNQQKNNNSNQNNNEIPKDLQQLILQKSANQERETARYLQNRKAYSAPESNEKDW